MKIDINIYFKIIIYFFAIIVVTSCENKKEEVSKKFIGNWAIDEFTYNNKNSEKDLLINYISFQKEDKFSIPEIFNYVAEDETDNTKWSITLDKNEKVKLKLNCTNPIFRGEYNVTFFKNYEKSLLGIKLKSKTTSILAYKMLQDFKYDGDRW